MRGITGERRNDNQSSATAMARETKQKKLSERGRKAATRTCSRENTMGHCCALGTLEQCRLPDSVNNPCRQPWGPPLDKSDIGRGGAISLHRLAYIHRSIRVRGSSRRRSIRPRLLCLSLSLSLCFSRETEEGTNAILTARIVISLSISSRSTDYRGRDEERLGLVAGVKNVVAAGN